MIYALVERHIAEGMETTYAEASRKTLEAAHRAPGFISGETLTDIQRPNHHYLLSKWRSLHDWKNWYYSDARSNSLNQLNPSLADFEKVTLLQP